MAIRSPHLRWLRSLASTLTRRRRASQPSTRRRIRLEQLESRYALTAPVAVDDYLFMQKNFTDAPIRVLNNDSDVVTVAEVTVNETVYDVTMQSGQEVNFSLDTGTLTLDSEHKVFHFTPDFDIIGSDSFTYRVSDGGSPLSNAADVSIEVAEEIGFLSDIPISTDEGDSLLLNPFDGDQPPGPGPFTYYWYVDFSLVSPIGGQPDPTFDVSWSALNSISIVDGQTNADIMLKVVDGGNENFASGSIGINDFTPILTTYPIFEVAPDGDGTCGQAPYHIVNTYFSESNPLETDFVVLVDWNFVEGEDFLSPVGNDTAKPADYVFDHQELDLDGNYVYSVTGSHIYTQPGDYTIVMWILGPGAVVNEVLTNTAERGLGFTSALGVTISGTADPPTADIQVASSQSVPGKAIELSNSVTAACGVTYTWAVNGVPVPDETGPMFSFTPTATGSYDISLTATNGVDTDGPDTVTIDVFPVVLDGTNLLVGGTTGDDTFAFTPTTTPGEFKLMLNGANQGNFSPTGVQVYGGDGSDAITVNGNTDSNAFEIHDGSIVLNGLPFDDDSMESRTINARGNGDSITVFGGGATVTGGSGSDTLTAATGDANTWTMSSLHAGTLNDVSFSSIEILVGDSSADELIGRHANTNWTVTGASSGTYGSTPFSNFETLQGGSANDTFRANGNSFGMISGGDGNDKLDYASYSTAVQVNLDSLDGPTTGFAGISGIENVAGGSGNDIIRGDGVANTIAGNQGTDIILGGGGNDTINGNGGRDILIGGVGADTIIGNADEDILIAGTTEHDGDDLALLALLSEWTSSTSYATRVSNITNGGGLNGIIVLVGDDGGTQTVFNDTDVDTLTGNGGVDWFFANQDGTGEAIDIVTDKTASELWNDTDF